MSRQEPSKKISKSSPLKSAIHRAVKRYRKAHKSVSAERQQDIDWLLETVSDFSSTDVQKHLAISHYMKSINVGLLGRSDLRRHVLHALESVPLMGLMDELIHRHKADIQMKEAQIHAMQAPRTSSGSQDLLLESKLSELQAIQEKYNTLNKKAKKISDINKRLFDKYEALKKSHSYVCRKYHEPCSFSSEVLSQTSLGRDASLLEGEEFTVDEAVKEAEESSSVDLSGPGLFRKKSLIIAVIDMAKTENLSKTL